MLEILTLNAAGDSWIDNVPGGVATGYQAQNTNFTARTLGKDLTTVEILADRYVLKGNSGVVDVLGVPYVVKNDVEFLFTAVPAGANFLEIVGGGSSTTRNVALTSIAPTWDAIKHYYKSSSGNRVLGWILINDDDNYSVRRFENVLTPPITSALSGIGGGGKRDYTVPGTYKLTIAKSGVYSIGVIAAGSTAGIGGGSGRVDLRLLAGQRIELTVGAVNNNSFVNISGRLSITTFPSNVTPTAINVIGSSFVSVGYLGGVSSTGGAAKANGGGAGLYAPGRAGIIVLSKELHGICQIGNFGAGETGTGYVIVEWLSE